MKRIFCFLLVFVLLPSFSFAEYNLSENEKNYVGAWSLYANNGNGKIYTFIITFLDNMEVVQNSITFNNSVLISNNKTSGEWSGFTDKTIIFSLSGTDMTAMIKDDGYLYLYFFDDLSLCGVYSRCEDMSRFFGW